jgi:hypothetical protein
MIASVSRSVVGLVLVLTTVPIFARSCGCRSLP